MITDSSSALEISMSFNHNAWVSGSMDASWVAVDWVFGVHLLAGGG